MRKPWFQSIHQCLDESTLNRLWTFRFKIFAQKNSIICITLILLVGLLSISWFKDDYLINGSDMTVPLSPMYRLERDLFVWGGYRGDVWPPMTLFPWDAHFALCTLLNLSVLDSEKIIFYMLFASSGLFMYFLTSDLIKGKEKHLAGLISALFYMMNPFTMQFRWMGGGNWGLFTYVLLPLMFLFFVRGLKERRNYLRYGVFVGITTLFFASGAVSPAYVIVPWLILFLYTLFDAVIGEENDGHPKQLWMFSSKYSRLSSSVLVIASVALLEVVAIALCTIEPPIRRARAIETYYPYLYNIGNCVFYLIVMVTIIQLLRLFKKEIKITHHLRFVLLVTIIFFALNMWWLLPSGWVAPVRYTGTITGLEGQRTVRSMQLESAEASFLNVLRMFGHWGFYYGDFGEPYVDVKSTYLTAPFILLSYLIPILVFCSLLLSRDRHIVYFSSMALLSVFLMKGVHPPQGEIYEWMFFNIPGFQIFRMQHDKFGIIQAFSYAFLVGYTIAKGYHAVESRVSRPISSALHRNVTIFVWKPAIVTLLIMLFGVYMYPFWTGNVIPPVLQNKIPIYYYDAATWINEQNDDFKIFSLPFRQWTSSPSVMYTWGYDGLDVTKELIHKPIISHGVEPPPMNLTNEIYTILKDYRISDIGILLGLLNVRYILLHNDFDIRVYGDQVDPPQYIETLLKARKEFHLEKTFGQLNFYENDYFIPHIFATSNVIYANVSSFRDLLELYLCETKKGFPTVNPPVIFSPRFLSIEAEGNPHPISDSKKNIFPFEGSIAFQKINPSKYRIHVNTSHPFILVFSEYYDSEWNAYYESNLSWIDVFYKEPIQEHFSVNGYANAWYVDRVGEYDIVLYFKPQSSVYAGLIVSSLSLIGCLVLIGRQLIINSISKSKRLSLLHLKSPS